MVDLLEGTTADPSVVALLALHEGLDVILYRVGGGEEGRGGRRGGREGERVSKSRLGLKINMHDDASSAHRVRLRVLFQ